MKKTRIKNPLRKRIFRELRDDFAKFFVIFVFMILIIGFVSGLFVANHSMITSYDLGIESHKLEDGHFELVDKPSKELIDEIENNDDRRVKVFNQYYKEAKEVLYAEKSISKNDKDKKSDVRIFKVRKEVNTAYVFSGRLPKENDEIAIDRMHADNVGITVGDTVEIGDKNFKVVGLVSNPDFSTLHRKNTDIMFDAISFDVALVTDGGFDRIDEKVHYNYAFRYYGDGYVRPKDKVQEKKWSDDLVEAISKEAYVAGNQVDNYLPNFMNQAIHFAPEDLGSDKAMGGVILYVLIVVLAFIFGITISNTITRESMTIGTLRASGFTRAEMISHYMAMPVMVTLLSALIGNVLGYSVFKNVVVGMYYNSYSLPTYHTYFSSEAFLKTTIIPIIIMFVVNFVVLSKKLRISPLRFLRVDLEKRKRNKTMRLPRVSFLSRFRMRVFLQNMKGYLVIFIGVLFVNIMLAMAVGMPQTLKYYQDHASDMMLAKVQTNLIRSKDELGNAIDTKETSAEKIAVQTLVMKNGEFAEDITVYGINKNSEYVSLPSLGNKEVGISATFAEKYGLKKGDTIKLEEKYKHKKYNLKVKSVIDYEGSLAVFMNSKGFEDLFSYEDGYYNAFFSDKKLSDIDSKYVMNEITKKDITRMADQMDHSMGAYMLYFQYLCIILSAVLMFLLTKLIIERNAKSISMTKILGYTSTEIAKIYLVPTTWAVIISAAISTFISNALMHYLWIQIFKDIAGYFSFVLTPTGMLKMFAFVMIGYLIVLIMDVRRIGKVPMDEALKNVD
ncbi:MAG: ABC transporter permease [Lachnospiraceae bacterium]|nr:ABC transporter permease [Lachnospiraceae bacterium]